MRHPLHSICPYFAMFPETFVAEQLYTFTRPGDLVFDPFCGRGTTVFESLLQDRDALGVDVNPVAACIAGAKAEVPRWALVSRRIDELESDFRNSLIEFKQDEFFSLCFHQKTFNQLCYIRRNINWKESKIDRFVAALALGVLHGESHKTALCLSNRMPRTISTKPAYSIKWWNERQLSPPDRDVFHVLRKSLEFRSVVAPPVRRGKVILGDARRSAKIMKSATERVSLVVTSPPYLDTTDYAEDQWLRLWFLGGNSRPSARTNRDDRHTSIKEYWRFLVEAWRGIEPLMRAESTIVVRIGGTLLSKKQLLDGLGGSLVNAMPNRKIKAMNEGKSSEIRRRQTNSFRPGTSRRRLEHDFYFRIS